MRLEELLRKFLHNRLADVRVALPVEVKAYDVAAQTVDVKPLIKNLVEAEDGVSLESLPVIPSVPVAFPRAGGFFVTFPIEAGDTGMVIVCDRSIDQWHRKGGEVEALDRRLHSFAGATFYPGLADSTNPLADAHATDMVIGEDGGSSIHFKPGGQIEIGSAPTSYVALATLVGTELTALKAAINGAIPLAGDGGAQFKAQIMAALAAWPGSVAAANTKAD